MRNWRLNNRRHRFRSWRAGSRRAGNAGRYVASGGLLSCCTPTRSCDGRSGCGRRGCGRDDISGPVIGVCLPRDILSTSCVLLRLLRRCEATILSVVHRRSRRRSRWWRVVLVCGLRKRCSTQISWRRRWSHLSRRALVVIVTLLLVVVVSRLELLVALRWYWWRRVMLS